MCLNFQGDGVRLDEQEKNNINNKTKKLIKIKEEERVINHLKDSGRPRPRTVKKE